MTAKIEMPRFHNLLAVARRYVEPSATVVMGSAPLAVRGLRDVGDLDLLVRPEVYRALQQAVYPGHDRGWEEYMKSGGSLLEFPGVASGISIFDRLFGVVRKTGLTVEMIEAAAEPYGEWRIVAVDHMVRFKRARRRDKDIKDLELLKLQP